MRNTETIEIVLNGERRRVAAGSTIERLLEELGVPPRGTAVELDGGIVPPGRLAETVLRDGQRVEVVRLVGGG